MNKKYWLFGIIIILIIIAGLFLIKDKSGQTLGASIFGITRTSSLQAKPAVPLTPETLVVTQTETATQAAASSSAAPAPAPVPPPPTPCALAISALPMPASQTVPVGTNNFGFARIRFAAPSSCSITLKKVVVGVQNNGGNIPGMIQNLKAFNNFNVQVGNTIASPTTANIIGSNLNIVIPANGSVVLAFRADVVGVGTGTIRLGESFTEAVKTGTTQQVGNGYQYWGQWMTIILPNSCSSGTICYMNGSGTNSVSAFNPTLGTWTVATASAQWPGRYAQQSVFFNNKIWVIGGVGGSFYSDVWSSPDGVTWTQATANAPWGGRMGFQAVVFNNKIWVMGGNDGNGAQCGGYLCNDVWSSPDGITWTQVMQNAPWSGRFAFKSVIFNNKMWVMGNSSNGCGTAACVDIWSSVDGVNWVQESGSLPWASRSFFGAIVFNNKIWVMGGAGNNNNDYNDVWSSVNGVTWTQATANAPWASRSGFGLVVRNNKMWIVGGSGGGQTPDMWSSVDGINWILATSSGPWNVGTFAGAAVTP